MKPKTHLIISGIVSLILFLFGLNAVEVIIFFVSSVFIIDLDHVPKFVFSERSVNPIKFLKWSDRNKTKWEKLTSKEKKKYKKPIYLFHNIESLMVLSFVSIYIPIIQFVIWGFIFHLVLDLFYNLYFNEEGFHKISIIYTLVKNKNRVLFE